MPGRKSISTNNSQSPVNPFLRALSDPSDELRKKFPNVKFGSARDETKDPVFIRVPDLMMQCALGRVGYVCGRIHYTLGPEGCSKTSKLLWMCDLCLRQGGWAYYVEWENALEASMIECYVENPDLLPVAHPSTLEEGMELIRTIMMGWKEADPEGTIHKIIVGDSIGGSVMQRALDPKRQMGDTRVGGIGLYMSDAIPTLNRLAVESQTLLCFIGQGREKIETGFAAMGGAMKPYHERVVGRGGKALPFHATYREVLQRGATLKDDNVKSGFTVHSIFTKNKVGVPWRQYSYNIQFFRSLGFAPITLEFLSVGRIGGLRVERKRYWCEEIGIGSNERMTADEIYPIIHSPEHIGHFQQALGIRADMGMIDTTESDLSALAKFGVGSDGEEEEEAVDEQLVA